MLNIAVLDTQTCNSNKLTDLTISAQVTCAGAVAYVAVPALFAQPPVATGGAAAALLQLPGAEAAHANSALDLGQAPDVPALAIDEEVAHAAHVAIVEKRSPDLWWQDEVGFQLRQTAQEHVAVQV